MSADPAQLFDEDYFRHGCGEPYARTPEWLNHFAKIAERITLAARPGSVLDAGCAMGFLVEALRDRRVEAFGVDVSPYAIAQVRDDVKASCWVGSVVDPFPQRYDLIACIEVLEHLPIEEGVRAVANLCRSTDDVLLSSSPDGYREATHLNVQPPDYWVGLFAEQGFWRDVEFDASFIAPWAMRFRRSSEPVSRLARAYERRHWLQTQQVKELRDLAQETRTELAERERAAAALAAELAERDQAVEVLTAALAERERTVEDLAAELAGFGPYPARLRYSGDLPVPQVPTTDPPSAPTDQEAAVDVVVWVRGARDDIERCLQAVVRYSRMPYSLILVDDGNDDGTKRYLAAFAEAQAASVLRNDVPKGYTLSANQGLRESEAASEGDHVVLMTSETIVGPGWLTRLVACADSGPRIGIVGPLSNATSGASVSDLVTPDGARSDDADDEVAESHSMAGLVAQNALRLYPRLPFLGGFCLMIKREVIDDVGLLDEADFAAGYGEATDYCLRARQRGWEVAVADDTYVVHRPSGSDADEVSRRLRRQAERTLLAKHGEDAMGRGLEAGRHDPVLEGIRVRSRAMRRRQRLVDRGLARWEGKRLLFLLSTAKPSDGTHAIFQEAKAMQRMGVDARVANVLPSDHQHDEFRMNHELDTVPLIALRRETDVSSLLSEFDALVACSPESVPWLDSQPPTIRAYYAQDIEPRILPEGAHETGDARQRPTLPADLVVVCKSEWDRTVVRDAFDVDGIVVGPSVDVDLFQPRRRNDPSWPERPLRVAAMIRPTSPRHRPRETMDVLRELDRAHGEAIEIVLFGCSPSDPAFHRLPTDFAWSAVGPLDRRQQAYLLNEVDLFAEVSPSGAMALAGTEAMACGVAVVGPRAGVLADSPPAASDVSGETPFVEWYLTRLARVIDDEALRTRLRRRAIGTIAGFLPEQAAFNILAALFDGRR